MTEALAPAPFRVAAPGDTAYYGATFKQLSMMQAPVATMAPAMLYSTMSRQTWRHPPAPVEPAMISQVEHF